MVLFLRLCLVVAFGFAALAEGQSQTQSELTEQAANEWKQADRLLNRQYQKLQGLLDKEAREKLRQAQKAWVEFRDKEAELRADLARGGSMAPMLFYEKMAGLTRDRTRQLKALEAGYSSP